jgi:predicted dinucleotide-binding enzyme
MNIVVIGRGNVGGSPAGLWRKAGHEVTAARAAVDLAWLLAAVVNGGVPVFDRFAVAGGL